MFFIDIRISNKRRLRRRRGRLCPASEEIVTIVQCEAAKACHAAAAVSGQSVHVEEEFREEHKEHRALPALFVPGEDGRAAPHQ